MTAEVCIMNRLAVVLAADSAATVSRWNGERFEQRFFKGSNKIFQLSDHHPVGIMIFDAADVMGVPWEIVVKTFRRSLGHRSFNTVEGYAEEFSAFLTEDRLLFPEQLRDEVFVSGARSAAIMIVARDDAEDDDATRLAENHRRVEQRRDFIKEFSVAPSFDTHCVDLAMTKYKTVLVEQLNNLEGDLARMLPDDRSLLAEVAIYDMLVRPQEHLDTSGLVFAGFGDHQVFPAYVEFKSCGLLCDKHVLIPGESAAITHNVTAKLASFAQTAMSDTFTLGLSEDVYKSMMQTLEEGLNNFARSMIERSGGNLSAISDFDEVVAQARKSMGSDVLKNSSNEHALPLRQVLGVLPVDEMAELAETLINLQALKEKVTKNTETVGGPVDVAIITKNEGLVWVKRKHFFDLQLNSRYVLRQQKTLLQ